MKATLLVLLFASLAILPPVNGQPPSGAMTNAIPAGLAGLPISNAVPAARLSPAGYVPDAKYKLRIGDRVGFQILEDRDAPKSLIVADSGELDIPYVGRVPAVEKTCKELAEALRVQLERDTTTAPR